MNCMQESICAGCGAVYDRHMDVCLACGAAVADRVLDVPDDERNFGAGYLRAISGGAPDVRIPQTVTDEL